MSKRKDRFVVVRKIPDGYRILGRGDAMTAREAENCVDRQDPDELVCELVPYTPKKRGKKQ